MPAQHTIGFDAKRAYNNKSGLGNFSRDHIRMCVDHIPEHHYKLFTPKAEESLANFHLGLPNTERISPTRGMGKISPSWWRSFGMIPDLRRHEVSLFHGLSASLPSGMKNWDGVKIVSVHDLIFEKYPRWYSRADKILHRRKLKHATDVADTIVAISKETAQDLEQLYKVDPNKIRVIYQSCHPAFRIPAETKLPPGLPEEYVIYVGSIEERKHLGELLQIIDDIGKIPIIVVGKKTSYFNKIQPLVEKLQRRGLYFHMQPDVVTLAALYKHALFSVYPSQAEGFGIPVIESLFSKTPVLAGSSPCLQEAGGPGGMYINPLNISEFTKGFKLLLTQSSVRESLAVEGFAHVEQFQPHKLAEMWKEVYR